MAIIVKNLTLRNFLSIGNAPQTLNFNREELVLVLGENLDMGGEDSGSRNGCGKAQPLTSNILTKSGWKKMGDLCLNDLIITPKGKQAKVTGIYGQGMLDTYLITFVDGRTVEASYDHLWKTYSHKFTSKKYINKESILTTGEIIEHLKKYENKNPSAYIYTPLIKPENISDICLPIDPWLLGATLGYAGLSVSSSVTFTTADEFMKNKMNEKLNSEFNCSLSYKGNSTNLYDYRVVSNNNYESNVLKNPNKFNRIIKQLNLCGTHSDTKFIPEIYKSSSVRQKEELLAGLMDTNGYIGKNGGFSICTTSRQLANDITYIVRSIGGLARIFHKKNKTYSYKGKRVPCKDSYNVNIRYYNMRNIVSLPRKRERLSKKYQYETQLRSQIKSIEFIGKKECQCIMVDDPEHLYVTDNFVVTHNTTIMNGLSYALFSWPISNIKKEHLINKTNGKNMLVTIEFESDGKEYIINRGLKPRVFEFFENGIKKEEKDIALDLNDTSQGDSRETQKEIETILNMSHDMFCQIVALNTYTTPFLFQKVSDQRTIIEQLLGITLLSEKAEKLKEEIKIAKEDVLKEDIRIKSVQEANKRIQDQINSLIRRQKLWERSKNEELIKLEKSIDFLSKIDIEEEIKIHSSWDEYNTAAANKEQLEQQKKHYETSLNKENKILMKLNDDLLSLENQCCQTCHQKIHDDVHKELLLKIKKEYNQTEKDIQQWYDKINEVLASFSIIPNVIKPKEKVYNALSDVYEHKNKLNLLIQQYEQKYNEIDPYKDQISEMQNTAIETIDLSTMNAFSSLVDHQEFLMKLLTNKDSFIRKKIIEQNLSYLNIRLDYYLTALGLPHTVIFQNDLDVNISELGRELSPGNLSRGEMARLQLGLSFAFRDVHESLYQKINLLGLDEMIDAGIDVSGTESAIKLLRDMSRQQNRDVWIISHKDELISKCNSVLTVTKENGYTSFNFNE